VAGDNCSWRDWVGKRGLHCSRNPSAYVANGIIDSTVIRLYDATRNVIETHEHKSYFKEW